jgi:hypothetical protein
MTLRAVDDAFMADFEAEIARIEAGSNPFPLDELPLKNADGSGTSPDVEIVDAKIAAAEARTDTKFAELRTDLAKDFGALSTQLASKPGTGTLIGTAVAIVGILLAALSYGGDRLAMGVGLADSRQEQLKRDQEQDTATKATDRKLDELLRRIPAKP